MKFRYLVIKDRKNVLYDVKSMVIILDIPMWRCLTLVCPYKRA